MAKFVPLIVGGLELAAGAAAIVLAPALAPYLIEAGGATIIGAAGTLLANRGPVGGYATTARNPTAPWEICYGRCRRGGTLRIQSHEEPL